MNRQINRYAKNKVKKADISEVATISDLDLDVIKKMADEQGESWAEQQQKTGYPPPSIDSKLQ